jgi:NAD(P)H-hydrate repair Nnr-like enzyme with NAD(P)H-hydrate dehydratase domain
VVLKGHTTLVCGASASFRITAPTTWLATAGTGDSLAGILGALVATHFAAVNEDEGLMARLAATAVLVHGLAAHKAGAGGPFTVLGLNAAIPAVIGDLQN